MRFKPPNKNKTRRVQRRKAFMLTTANFTKPFRDNDELPRWMSLRLLVISYVRRCRKERTGYYLKNKTQ